MGGVHMKDRTPQHAGRVHLEPVSGQTNTFDMTMADGATEQGTALNKANLLKDATAALFGLTEAAVPDDVFAWLGRFNEYHWRRRTVSQSGNWELVYSTDRSAYPDLGTQDGYEYEYLGVPFDNLPAAPKIETGFYLGTGTYGSANPSSIAMGFVPKLLIIASANTAASLDTVATNIDLDQHMYLVYSSVLAATNNGTRSGTVDSKKGTSTSVQTETISTANGGKTFSWYGESATSQMNVTGRNTYWIAIG